MELPGSPGLPKIAENEKAKTYRGFTRMIADQKARMGATSPGRREGAERGDAKAIHQETKEHEEIFITDECRGME
jgi:hypothetical protein